MYVSQIFNIIALPVGVAYADDTQLFSNTYTEIASLATCTTEKFVQNHILLLNDCMV